MNKFKILWIDDQKEKIAIEKEKVENIICKYDYSPEIELISDFTREDLNEDSEIFNRIKSREFDLLFIDYKLKHKILGSDVISKIRNLNKIYIDIVFYSSSTSSLINTIKDSYNGSILNYIDDVHIVLLDDSDFEEKIENIVVKIIGSWYNANSIRGVILSNTSLFEKIIDEIIIKYHSNYEKDLIESFKEKKENKIKQIELDYDKAVKSDETILYITKHPESFNWSIRHKMFNILIEKKAFSIDENINIQINSLFQLRNDIAHNNARIENGLLKIKKGENIRIYSEREIFEMQMIINNIYESLNKLLNKPIHNI